MNVQVEPRLTTVHCRRPPFIAAVLLGSALEVVAAASGPPKFDVSQSCEAAAREALVVGRSKETCMADERTAQDQIARNWSQYSGLDRAQCVGLVSKGGPPSYVEVLSCLEIMRDARATRLNGPEDPLLSNEGQMGSQSLGGIDENAFDTSGPPNRIHVQRQKHQHGHRQ